MLLSSSLIANTLNALLTQHLRQIGVMKLVGARSFQILGMYLLLILAYGVIALVIAVPLGGLAGYGLAMLIAYFMNATLQGFRLVPVAILLQTLVLSPSRPSSSAICRAFADGLSQRHLISRMYRNLLLEHRPSARAIDKIDSQPS